MGKSDNSRNSRDANATRRTLLKATGVAGLGAVLLPSSWTKPILKAVVVPAHAQTTPAATTTTNTTTKRPRRTTTTSGTTGEMAQTTQTTTATSTTDEPA